MTWVLTPVGHTSDQGPWLKTGPGRYISQTTGMRKYVPNEDPAWHADLKRAAGFASHLSRGTSPHVR